MLRFSFRVDWLASKKMAEFWSKKWLSFGAKMVEFWRETEKKLSCVNLNLNMSRGGGLVVSIQDFCSDNPSSILAAC